MAVKKKQKGIYENVSVRKSNGITYTPSTLADFVAEEIVQAAGDILQKDTITIFDPAFGHGQLFDSLLHAITRQCSAKIIVHGYETDESAYTSASQLLSQKYPNAVLDLKLGDFLSLVPDSSPNLLDKTSSSRFDLIIANPPYVRTQIMGAKQSKYLSQRFHLTGRVDLYYAFIAGLSEVLTDGGILGLIVSNRFMTTRAGQSVRQMFHNRYNLLKIWDFGDTKLFNASVLPAVLLASGGNICTTVPPDFTSIYETKMKAKRQAKNPIEAVKLSGIVKTDDGRSFNVQHGSLASETHNGGVWHIETPTNTKWLNTVNQHTAMTFRDIGKIRVGVKTTADKVFIRSDWLSITKGKRPELLRPLITHHIARQFRAAPSKYPLEILYPHEIISGERRACDLALYPNSAKYLRQNQKQLESRDYVIEAGRQWYEIWVPQDPAAWHKQKLVFRDISETPTFWLDTNGSVVNGDCYWLTSDTGNLELLWLAAAVANSSFIEVFYDNNFCNKLYSGRRRFITQYVEKFPLPDPDSKTAQKITQLAKNIYNNIEAPSIPSMKQEVDELVWQSFGLVKKIGG